MIKSFQHAVFYYLLHQFSLLLSLGSYDYPVQKCSHLQLRMPRWHLRLGMSHSEHFINNSRSASHPTTPPPTCPNDLLLLIFFFLFLSFQAPTLEETSIYVDSSFPLVHHSQSVDSFFSVFQNLSYLSCSLFFIATP